MARVVLRTLTVIALAFLIAPVLIVVPMAFSKSAFLQFPPPGYSVAWFKEFFSSEAWMGSLWLSLRVAFGATIVAVTFGTMAAYAVVRYRGRGKGAAQSILMLPMVLPLVVFAVGAYLISLRFGLVGSYWLLVVAHGVIGLPFVLLTVSASLRTTDARLEAAAQTLGSSRAGAFGRVTLPLIAPAVLGGAAISLMLSLDETVVALFLTKDLAPTLPVRIFSSIRYELDPLVPVAGTVVLGITVLLGGLLLLLRWLAVRRVRGVGTVSRRVPPGQLGTE